MATCSKSMPTCCQDSVPCKHIRQAVNRRHHACVKLFWGLRNESDVQEMQLLKEAVVFAARNRDSKSLEFLLSNGDQEHVRSAFPADICTGVPRCTGIPHPWAEWRDIYQIALKYKMPADSRAVAMMQKAMECWDWDFLEKAQEYGYDVEKTANIYIARHPEVAALKAFLAQDAFSTINFTWLTPEFAVERSDPALLEFARQLQGTQVAHELTVTAASMADLNIH